MPYKSISDLPPTTSKLSAKQKRAFLHAFNSAWDGTCKDSKDKEACAARVAWSAAGKAAKSAINLDLPIVKAVMDSFHRMYWNSSISADLPDKANDRLDKSLLDDLAHAFNIADPKPFLDVCHVSTEVSEDMADIFRVGSIKKVWRSGRYLKAEGFFDETPIGRAAFFQVLRSRKGTIRTSLAIIPDWDNVEFETVDGQEIRVFKGGTQTARFLPGGVGLTSVPMNDAVDLEVELTRSNTNRVTLEDDLMAVLNDPDLVREILIAKRSRLKRAGYPDSVQPVLVKGESVLIGEVSEIVDETPVTLFLARTQADDSDDITQSTRSLGCGISPKPWGSPTYIPEWEAEGVQNRPENFLDWTNYAWPVVTPLQRSAIKEHFSANLDQYDYTEIEKLALRQALVKAIVQSILTNDEIIDKSSAIESEVTSMELPVTTPETPATPTVETPTVPTVEPVVQVADNGSTTITAETEEQARAAVQQLTNEALAEAVGATPLTYVPNQPNQVQANTFEEFIHASGSGLPQTFQQTIQPSPLPVQSTTPPTGTYTVPAGYQLVPIQTPAQTPVQASQVSPEGPMLQMTPDDLKMLLSQAVRQGIEAAVGQQRGGSRQFRHSLVPAGAAGVTPSAIVTRSQQDEYAGMSVDEMCLAVVKKQSEQTFGLFG